MVASAPPVACAGMVAALRELPPIWLEGRWPLELAALRAEDDGGLLRGETVPHGDGGPVLLVCGFLAGDPSLSVMAGWLKRIGHRPSRAGIRFNVGCTAETVAALELRLEALADRYGRKVAVVGQSRGGVCARVLAVRRPDLVERVVTLGSPLITQLDIHPVVWAQVHAVGALGSAGVPGLLRHSCHAGACCAEVRVELETAVAPVIGFTSIYSRTDGIVRWRSCLLPGAEHVEVQASHIGMAVHPDVYRTVARALATPVEVPVAVVDASAVA